MQHAQIFVNLPITDMARSQAFYTALGYRFNPDFTNEQGACLVLGENLFAMLLVKPFFQGFTSRTIADAHQSAQVLVALPCADRAAVDALVQGAIAAGARPTARSRTWVSCTRRRSRTPMATSGSPSGWTRRPSRPRADYSSCSAS